MAKVSTQILREQRNLYTQMMNAAIQLRHHEQDLNLSSCTYLSRDICRDMPYALYHHQDLLDKATAAYRSFITAHNLPWTPEK